MLKPVRKPDALPDASRFVNHKLEAETLGVPSWLQGNAYDDEAMKSMRIIGEYPAEMFLNRGHRFLAEVFENLSIFGHPPTIGQIKAEATELHAWTEDESDKSLITPGLLAELEELGRCPLTMDIEGTVERLLRDNLTEIANLYRKREFKAGIEILRDQATNWHPGREHDIARHLDELNRIFAERPGRGDQAVSIADLATEHIEALERQAAGEEPRRIRTGFKHLDNATGGLLPGNVIVLGARTSMGKTSASTDLALTAAKAGHPAVYFTLEMSAPEIMVRFAAKEARIPVLRLRHGTLTDWQMEGYRGCKERLSRLPLFVDDTQHTPQTIEARIRDLNRQGRHIELAILDHIQLLGASERGKESRYMQISSYTQMLKSLAKSLDLTLVVLSQLNRQAEQRPINERQPKLSDLRDSGSIGEDADVVLLLYRPIIDKEDADPTQAEIWIAKNRSGPTGRGELLWNGELCMFVDRNPTNDQEAVLDRF